MTDSQSFPECEQFKESQMRYKTCRHERLTPDKCDRWRVAFGLAPLKPLTRAPQIPRYSSSDIPKSVGTEFKQLVDSLNIPTPEGCNCEGLRIEMDQLGVLGCRLHRDRLIGALRENSGKVSWVAKLMAIGPAIASGLAFKVDPLDPIPGIFDEAVRIADEKRASTPPAPPATIQTRPTPRQRKGGCCGGRKRGKTDADSEANAERGLRWAYGITTTSARKESLLPRTVKSLAAAGFDQPVLFVDDCTDPKDYTQFGLRVTTRRSPAIGNFANWWLSLLELYLEEPKADRYAIFEDDIVACRNLKLFLEASEIPEDCYVNLFLFHQNEKKAQGYRGWFESNQRGLGAQGLVFTQQQVKWLLSSEKMVDHRHSIHGRERIDGAILTALKEKGCRELCHFPSLLQHVGLKSSIPGHPVVPPSHSFPGEDFDARIFLREPDRLEPICSVPETTRLSACVHRGKSLRVEPAANGHTVNGRGPSVEVFACNLHGECAEVPCRNGAVSKVCNSCPDRLHPAASELPELQGPTNLLWYVWPRRETREVWQEQQELIRQSISKFDGKKFCVVATDASADVDGIDRTLWDDLIHLPNDPQQREVPGWRWLMDRVSKENGATIWLHAKGVWRGTKPLHLKMWWKLGYETMLDVEGVRNGLHRHAIVGLYRRNVYQRNIGVPWHFSGTFYGFRNDWVFQRDWLPMGKIDSGGWYAEAWPALMAPTELTKCLRFDDCPDLYQRSNWREPTCT